MIFKQTIMIIICLFFILGAADFFIGNRFGVGSEFERAFFMVGRVMLAITGMICLSPVLAEILRPVITPVFTAIGADSAMFASTILAPDAGGFALAMDLAEDASVGAWAGTVVAAHIGSAFSFVIPTASSVVPKTRHRDYSLGALSGLIACPFGCVLGGVLSGLPVAVILVNLIPAITLSLVVALGLYFIPNAFMKGFIVFGRILTAIILFGMTLATIERLTGVALIGGMNPISDAFTTAGTIGLTMGGVFVMTVILSKLLRKQLAGLSRKIGINEISILHCFNSVATIFPGFAAYEEMNPRGRAMYSALCASSASVFGAHLGFIGIMMPEMLMPMVVSKIFSGSIAIIVTLMFSSRLNKQDKATADATA